MTGPRPTHVPRLLALLAACLATSTPLARLASSDDLTPRDRYFRDGDARALEQRLATSADPRDRADAMLAHLAADPGARVVDAAAQVPTVEEGYLAIPGIVQSLRQVDVQHAKERIAAAVRGDGGLSGAWLEALILSRLGDDEGAARRILDGPLVLAAKDDFSLALLAAALPPDDRDLLGAVVRLATLRAVGLGRFDLLSGLAEGAAAVCPAAGVRVLVIAARSLRRAERMGEAVVLLTGGAAARAGLSSPALRLERAILYWRRGDWKSARAEANAGQGAAELAWAYDALAKAGDCCRLLGSGPPLPTAEGDLDVAVLSRFATMLGAKAGTEALKARAAASATPASDPAFVRSWLATSGLAYVEVAGDASAAEAAVAKGLPVLLWTLRRQGDGFRDHPTIVRGVDRNTGLWVVDELDPEILDLVAMDRAAKSRLLIAVPSARAADLDSIRNTPAARVGAALSDALAGSSSAAAEVTAASLATKAGEFPGAAVLDLYLGHALYRSYVAKSDRMALAAARAALARSVTSPPPLAFEKYVVGQSFGGGESDAALATLDEATRLEGDGAYLREARWAVLQNAARYPEAVDALEATRAMEPLDTRTLYFRAIFRLRHGDRVGARTDLVRVLDRRPGYLVAGRDLARMYVDDGRPDQALAVVLAMAKGDAEAARSPQLHDLRADVEDLLVKHAGSPADLRALAKSPEAETRVRVAGALAMYETEEAEAVLRPLLDDADERVRVRTLRAYLKPWMKDRVAEGGALGTRIAGVLSSDPSRNVRGAAADLLAGVDAPFARQSLAASLVGPRRDAEVSVRVAAANALSGRDAPEVRSALVAALSDEAVEVRAASIGSLQAILGSTNGFVADDPPEKRAAAIRAWQEWARAGR